MTEGPSGPSSKEGPRLRYHNRKRAGRAEEVVFVCPSRLGGLRGRWTGCRDSADACRDPSAVPAPGRPQWVCFRGTRRREPGGPAARGVAPVRPSRGGPGSRLRALAVGVGSWRCLSGGDEGPNFYPEGSRTVLGVGPFLLEPRPCSLSSRVR